LRKQFGARIFPSAWEEITGLLGGAGLLVNTTTLGMVNEPPLEVNLRCPPSLVVADLVYVPLVTPLLATARERGLTLGSGVVLVLDETVDLKAILRRMERMGEQKDTGPIEHHGLVMDPNRRRVTVDGDDVGLTPLEFEILLTLARDPGVVLSRDQLMDRVWGYRDFAGGRVVDSHVARIRRKLGEDGNEPRFIRTVHGVGYAFQERS